MKQNIIMLGLFFLLLIYINNPKKKLLKSLKKEKFDVMSYNGSKNINSLFDHYEKSDVYPISAYNGKELNKTDHAKIITSLKHALNVIVSFANDEIIPIKFNIQNRPIKKRELTFKDISPIYNYLSSIISKKIEFLYITKIENIFNEITENQGKLIFDMIVEYNSISNILINVEIILEKNHVDEDDFFKNKKNHYKIYLSKLQYNPNYYTRNLYTDVSLRWDKNYA